MSKTSSISLYLFLEDITLDGGCERVVVNMANEFSKLYQNVHIVSNFQSNDKIKFEIDESVKINFIHPCLSLEKWKSNHSLKFLFKSGIFYKLFLSIGFTTKLYEYILKNRTKDDTPIVLFHGYDTAWYKKKNIKLIGVDHSNFPFYKNDSFFYRNIKFPLISFMNRKLDIVTILTDAEIKYWKKLNRPVHIIPNFIPNIPEIIPSAADRNKTLISMGRMNTDQKGFDRLIKGFAKISNKFPDWKLIIYGDGKFKNEYQRLIDNYKLKGKVQLENFTENPYEVFSENSIYVMCSRTEGFGLVLAEAMACGMAAVSYENTGPNSIIRDNNNGYLIPNGDEAMLCNKLEQLMTNLDLRVKFSTNGRIDILNRYSAHTIISKWNEIFQLIA